MKHKTITKKYHPRLASDFGLLGEKDQAYIDSLTAQLAKIHNASPETRRLPEKNGKRMRNVK
jgi:hypothetical protein